MIDSITALRQLYPQPHERALRKQLTGLDPHCRRFIELSPFVVISSTDQEHHLDASPRGGPPGFVRFVDEHTLWIPDASGNNRLDTLANIIATAQIGLLFMVPGIDETLRVNGSACLIDDQRKTTLLRDDQRTPQLLIEVTVREAYLHCAKAFMRARLWSDGSRVDRSVYPSISQVIRDQIGGQWLDEGQAHMAARYAEDLSRTG